MAEFKVLLHKNARNVEQIEDYWFRRLRARSGQQLARADMQYLIETGRADEVIYAHLMEKPTYWEPFLNESRKARIEDGDQTLWTQVWDRGE